MNLPTILVVFVVALATYATIDAQIVLEFDDYERPWPNQPHSENSPHQNWGSTEESSHKRPPGEGPPPREPSFHKLHPVHESKPYGGPPHQGGPPSHGGPSPQGVPPPHGGPPTYAVTSPHGGSLPHGGQAPHGGLPSYTVPSPHAGPPPHGGAPSHGRSPPQGGPSQYRGPPSHSEHPHGEPPPQGGSPPRVAPLSHSGQHHHAVPEPPPPDWGPSHEEPSDRALDSGPPRHRGPPPLPIAWGPSHGGPQDKAPGWEQPHSDPPPQIGSPPYGGPTRQGGPLPTPTDREPSYGGSPHERHSQVAPPPPANWRPSLGVSAQRDAGSRVEPHLVDKPYDKPNQEESQNGSPPFNNPNLKLPSSGSQTNKISRFENIMPTDNSNDGPADNTSADIDANIKEIFGNPTKNGDVYNSNRPVMVLSLDSKSPHLSKPLKSKKQPLFQAVAVRPED